MGIKVNGIIGIKDEVSSVLGDIKKSQLSFRQDVKETQSAMEGCYNRTWKTKIDDNAAYQKISAMKAKISGFKQDIKAHFTVIDQASLTIDKIKNKLSAVKNTIVSPMVNLKDATTTKIKAVKKNVVDLGKLVVTPVVMLKDKATATINSIKGNLSSIKDKVFKPVITAVDKTGSVISSVGSKLKSIGKSLIIPVTVAATVATAGIAATVNSGMKLEQQQLSIKHFIGATNKDYNQEQIDAAAKEFTEQLRTNANASPFETGEVIQAGSRAISLTQGNREEAMSLVKLAEDMAAASGGTASVQDAIEALGDAKLGEMERLKGFGFKVSAEEFDKKGFSGVSKDLQNFFGGASEKLATSGGGLLSTINGKLKSSVADFGLKIVEQLKPVMTGMIDLIDKAMPYIDKFGTAFGEGISTSIKLVSSAMPAVVSAFETLSPVFDSLKSGITQMMPPIISFSQTVITTIKSIVVAAIPVIQTIISAISAVLPVLQPIFSTIVTTIGNIVTTVMPPLSAAINGIKDAIIVLAPIVETVFNAINIVVTNVIDGITGIITGGMELISAVWSGDWQGICDAVGTIFGGIGEILKAPVNAIIGILNAAIGGINDLSVDIPDWIPGIGGQHWGLDLPQIPYLAKGGIVDKPTPAIFGEAGKEAVVPLERNTGWMSPVVDKILSGFKSAPSPTAGGSDLITAMQGIRSGIFDLVSLFKGMPMPAPEPSKKDGNGDKNIEVNVHVENMTVRDDDDIEKIGETIVKKLKEVTDNS